MNITRSSDNIKGFLARAPLAERLAALSHALSVVPLDERQAVAMELFEIASAAKSPARQGAASPIELLAELPRKGRIRHAQAAMRAIVERWDRVPDSARPLIGGLARQRWIDAASEVAASQDPTHRINAARFAHDTADPGMARMVCGLLHDADSKVRLQADRSLMRLVLTLLGHLKPEQLGQEFAAIAASPRVPLPAEKGVIELERVELCRRVADAAWSFADHRCRAPLVGSLLILDRLPGAILERKVAERIRRLLKEKHHPSHSALRGVLRGTPSPLLRERALRWIVLDGITSVCVDRLSSADSLTEHELVLSRAHLCLRPSRGSRLRKVRVAASSGGSLPDAKTLKQLTARSRIGAIRFVHLIGLEETDRRGFLESTLADPEPAVRLAGMHAAHAADLSDYSFDPEPSIACSAATRWSTLGITPPRIGSPISQKRRSHAELLQRSPHAGVRAIANAELDRLDLFRGRAASRVAARNMFERDPIGFVRLVRSQFTQDARIMPALELIRWLSLSDRFEMDLLDLAANDADDRVRATAVALLGESGTDSARRVVHASLKAHDPRVRSNAIESIPPVPEALLEYKNDSDHRVRATAVRRVLSLDALPANNGIDAGDSLTRLLTDDRPAHRLAGAWAAERSLRAERRDALGPTYRPAVREVIRASEHDREPRIRARAARCVRLLKLEDPAAQGVA